MIDKKNKYLWYYNESSFNSLYLGCSYQKEGKNQNFILSKCTFFIIILHFLIIGSILKNDNFKLEEKSAIYQAIISILILFLSCFQLISINGFHKFYRQKQS